HVLVEPGGDKNRRLEPPPDGKLAAAAGLHYPGRRKMRRHVALPRLGATPADSARALPRRTLLRSPLRTRLALVSPPLSADPLWSRQAADLGPADAHGRNQPRLPVSSPRAVAAPRAGSACQAHRLVARSCPAGLCP